MKITITVRNCIENKEYDIQVDHQQRIGTTLRVLGENIPEILEGMQEKFILKSYRNKRRVNPDETYEHEMIFNGDMLLIQNMQ